MLVDQVFKKLEKRPEDYLMPLDSAVRHQAERGPRATAIYPGPAAAAAMPVQGAREIGCV